MLQLPIKRVFGDNYRQPETGPNYTGFARDGVIGTGRGQNAPAHPSPLTPQVFLKGVSGLLSPPTHPPTTTTLANGWSHPRQRGLTPLQPLRASARGFAVRSGSIIPPLLVDLDVQNAQGPTVLKQSSGKSRVLCVQAYKVFLCRCAHSADAPRFWVGKTTWMHSNVCTNAVSRTKAAVAVVERDTLKHYANRRTVYYLLVPRL